MAISPLQIAFLDVGHGDTIIISTKEKNVNRVIIVDCNDAIKTKNYILNNKIQIIDYIIITHLHQDHYRGINSLIDLLLKNNIKVKNICWEKDKYLRTDEDQKNRYKIFTSKLDEYHINGDIGYIGKRFEGSSYRRIDNNNIQEYKVEIIYPNSLIANYFDDKNVNNTSTVIRIQYNNFKIILPGDLEGEGWKKLKENVTDLKCDILKMPHHGGYFVEDNNSISTSKVIDLTKPNFSIISTGQNDNYNHPSKETIECLTSKGVNILCTQATNLCDKDRLSKKECVMSKLGITHKGNKNHCPCVGDIVFEINSEIRLVSQQYKTVNEVKSNFKNRICTDIR